MTHSLLFAAIIAAGLTLILKREFPPPWKLGTLLFVIIVSHGVFDAMTNGGLGIAFFSPFNTQRYFFSWRPIQVSPIGIRRFFTWRAMHILSTEILWVWLPALLFAVLVRLWQGRNKPGDRLHVNTGQAPE